MISLLLLPHGSAEAQHLLNKLSLYAHRAIELLNPNVPLVFFVLDFLTYIVLCLCVSLSTFISFLSSLDTINFIYHS